MFYHDLCLYGSSPISWSLVGGQPCCSDVSLVHQSFINKFRRIHLSVSPSFRIPSSKKHGTGDPRKKWRNLWLVDSSPLPCLTAKGYINLQVFSLRSFDADLKQLVYRSFIDYMMLHESGSDLLHPPVHICMVYFHGCSCSSPMLT